MNKTETAALAFLIAFLSVLPPIACAQDHGGSGASQSGIVISSLLRKESTCRLRVKHERIVTYRISENKLPDGSVSSTVPYILTWVSKPPKHEFPILKSGDTLTIVLKIKKSDSKNLNQNGYLKNVSSLELNVASAQASPINPAPLRVVFTPPVSKAAATGQAPPPSENSVCWTWPIKLRGDTVPTVTITAVYRPPAQPKAAGKAAAVNEKTITLLQMAYPQVHSLSYYNLAAGVVASTLKNPSFNRVETALPTDTTKAQYSTITDPGSPSVSPVLFFSAYIIPLDAERPFHWSDMIPAPGVGFDLSSPATNFFFGASSEFPHLRNLQLIYGYNYGKVTELVPGAVDDPTSSTAPVTRQHYGHGFFAGLTFDISFIQSLFGGGK